MNPEQTIVMMTANSHGPIDFSRQGEVQMLQKPFELMKLDLLKAILSSMQSVEAEESNTKELLSALFWRLPTIRGTLRSNTILSNSL
jgi:hypothetical protein